jgi:hypothetical protein
MVNKRDMKILLLVSYLFFFLISNDTQAQKQALAATKKTQTLPVIPVGWDAYLRWDQWPLQRIGDRAYMRSTYDRTGANVFADMSNFLFMKGEDQNVTLDISGKGIMYFFRFNFWHGSPWHFVVDGKDNIVKETGTDDPVNARTVLKSAEFIPLKPFPEPLAWTWKTTKGADLIWTPMPFEKSFQLAYSKTTFGTGYYIYHQYANEDQLSRPIQSWSMNEAPESAVTTLLERAGTDIAPKNITTKTGKLKLNKSRLLIKEIKANASVIRALKFSLPLNKAIDLEHLHLKITWDDAKQPSIDAPLCLFFGAGTLYNRDNKEYLVKGFPINIRYDFNNQKVELACYYPMPFSRSAKFELSGIQPGEDEIDYEIRYEPLITPINHNSYFHASYKDFPQPEPGKDLFLLDTRGIEGNNEWSGNFAGTSIIFSHDGILRGLEGDPRFFFDDSQGPQAYGTGTEEWGGGGFYWGGENMTLPLAGHPCGASAKATAKNDKDLIESCYRFLLADLMPFGKRAVIRLEHGAENLSTAHYETVTYWYGLPAPSLIKTDSLDIGNVVDEKKHYYHSPQSSPVETISSRYEWGIDTFPVQPWPLGDLAILRRPPPADVSTIIPPEYELIAGKEVFPVHSEDGRYTRSISEFNIQLASWNQGVLLRRKLDYSFPNQKAAIYIAHINPGGNNKELNWEYVGEWYLAGSNTYVFSRPEGELDNRQITIKTSNRRFRDDEFMIPAKFTKDQPAIRIRIQYIPVEKELYPGQPFPKESAWSELKYDVYSYCLPKFPE